MSKLPSLVQQIGQFFKGAMEPEVDYKFEIKVKLTGNSFISDDMLFKAVKHNPKFENSDRKIENLK